MSGVIESFDSRAIRGWMMRTTTCRPAHLYLVRSSGELMATCMLKPIERADLGERGWGFSLEVPEGLRLEDLAIGAVRFCVDSKGGNALKLWRPAHAAALTNTLTDAEVAHYSALLSKGTKKRLESVLLPGLPANTGPHAHSGVGAISADEAAIIGREGVLFLFRGNNDVLSLYQKAASERISAAWLELVQRRSSNLALLGCRFLQLFVPEKTSSSFELVPYPCAAGSAQYLSTMAHLASEDSVVDGLHVLRASLARDAAYRKLDSHLSPLGCQVLVRHLLARMGYRQAIEAAQTEERMLMADLAWRFEDLYPKGLEKLVLASRLAFAGQLCDDPALIAAVDVDSGHVGTWRQWSTPTAPLDLRVLCFGNSFFERGNHSTSLSWWFPRIFREFKFVWSADMDLDIVREYAPDVVICQTVERFMARVPNF